MQYSVPRGAFNQLGAESMSTLEVAQGSCLCRIEHYSFTANNISYAATGTKLRYWDHFPIAKRKDHGIIPVWGVASVILSRHPAIVKGDRIYGYFPMSDYIVLNPKSDQLSPTAGFVDASPHRQDLPAAYSSYTVAAKDPFYPRSTCARTHIDPVDRHAEYLMVLLRPLFFTSWLIDDFMAAHKWFKADQIIITSASSKTSLGLAFCIQRHRRNTKCIGLTSTGNVDFCSQSGLYEQVLSYDNWEQVLSSQPAGTGRNTKTVIVDIAGNSTLLARLHSFFGQSLRYSCLVGATHVQEAKGANSNQISGVKPVFFFAPAAIKDSIARFKNAKRMFSTLNQTWQSFLITARRLFLLNVAQGQESIVAAYDDVLNGRVPPNQAIIMSML